MKAIHTAMVNSHPVRFYRCPIAGKEDLVWHSVDDLQRALGLPRALRQQMQAKMGRDWTAETRTIVSEGKRVILEPHSFGQGLAGAHDQAALGIEEDGPMFVAYCKAAVEAERVLTKLDGLTPEESISKALRSVIRGEAGHVH